MDITEEAYTAAAEEPAGEAPLKEAWPVPDETALKETWPLPVQDTVREFEQYLLDIGLRL